MFRRSSKNPSKAKGAFVTEEDVLAFEAESPDLARAVADAEYRLELARRLASTRRRRGLSQAEVARRMGTTQSAVSDLEGGAHDPYLSTLQRYARAVAARVEVYLAVEDGWVPRAHDYVWRDDAPSEAVESTSARPVEAVVGPTSWGSPEPMRISKLEVELCG